MITQEQFLKALNNNKAVRPQDMELLVSWYKCTNHTISAEKVIEVTGAKRASLIINNLGKRVAGFLEVEAAGAAVIADEAGADNWTIKNELAQAMVAHGVVSASAEVAAQPIENAQPVEKAVKAAVAAVEEAVEETFEPEAGSLDAVLAEFDRTTIRAAYPTTPAQSRLLQPEVIQILTARRPTNNRDYQRVIPAALRKSISTQETKRFLTSVFNILKKA